MAKIRKEKGSKIIKPSEFLKMTPAQQKKVFKAMAPTLNWMFKEDERRGGFQDDWKGKIDHPL
ncbi:MAG: hypothetical protein NTX82_04310 [Candidatus Parcubacteria bacterium]|nr:hypothetical protein [Candidatus Parcubacteria bacterium]